MFRRWPLFLGAIPWGLFITPDVFAGWVIIKNETKQAVVVVEIAGTPARPIQGKPVKLQPGETYREFQAGAGTKTFAIYDATKLNAPIAQQAVTWPAEDSTFGHSRRSPSRSNLSRPIRSSRFLRSLSLCFCNLARLQWRFHPPTTPRLPRHDFARPGFPRPLLDSRSALPPLHDHLHGSRPPTASAKKAIMEELNAEQPEGQKYVIEDFFIVLMAFQLAYAIFEVPSGWLGDVFRAAAYTLASRRLVVTFRIPHRIHGDEVAWKHLRRLRGAGGPAVPLWRR